MLQGLPSCISQSTEIRIKIKRTLGDKTNSKIQLVYHEVCSRRLKKPHTLTSIMHITKKLCSRLLIRACYQAFLNNFWIKVFLKCLELKSHISYWNLSHEDSKMQNQIRKFLQYNYKTLLHRAISKIINSNTNLKPNPFNLQKN